MISFNFSEFLEDSLQEQHHLFTDHESAYSVTNHQLIEENYKDCI